NQVPQLKKLDYCIAVLQHCCMKQVIQISKRGTITLPPAYRNKLGLNRIENPLMLVEERDGKLIMELAAAMPVRDIPKKTLQSWINEDEADGKALRANA